MPTRGGQCGCDTAAWSTGLLPTSPGAQSLQGSVGGDASSFGSPAGGHLREEGLLPAGGASCEVSLEVGGFAGLGTGLSLSPQQHPRAPSATRRSGSSPPAALILNAALLVLLIEV